MCLVAQAGFEPATYGVCSHRSTAELQRVKLIQRVFYAVFRGTYPSSRVVSSCANANECATLPHYFAVCKAYLHLFLSIVRPSLIRDINPSRLTPSMRAIRMGSCLKT